MPESGVPQPQTLPPARWLWQRSLRTRILLSYGAVVLLVLLLLAALIGRAVYQAMIDEAEHTLELEAFLAANALEDPLSGYEAEFEAYRRWDESHSESESENDHEAGADEYDSGEGAASSQPAVPDQVAGRLAQVAAIYAADTGSRVTILDPHGNVVADSAYAFNVVPNQLDQIEVQAALNGQEQHDLRSDPFSGELAVFVAAPIQQGDQILGLVQMTRPMHEVAESFRRFLLQLAGISLLALALATLLGLAVSRRLVRPVQQLEQAALQVASGDLNQQAPVETADELGALAMAFNGMVRELRKMMAQQRLFVANASHELRTPLTNIKLRSEALLGGASEDPAVARRYLAEIDQEADRLGRLANALLDLSRLEEAAGRGRPQEAVDLLPVLRSVAGTSALRAEQAGLDLQVILPHALPRLAVWPEQVEAALVNLLDNAIKYTPAGGQVQLSVEAVADRCLIHVADTGPGIPAEDIPHIFERFYRADKARSHSSGRAGWGSGAGLGLAIVKTLVEQNGGQISVASDPQRGATFLIELPLAWRG